MTDFDRHLRLVDDPDERRSRAQIAIDEGWIDELVASLQPDEQEALLYDWTFWRRPAQRRPVGMGTRYSVWMIRKGRGGGKTRTGSEECRDASHRVPLFAIVAPTAGDARDILVEGESGVLSVFPPDERPHYEPSKRRITFQTGSRATVFSAEDPDRLRGPQFYWGWFDEPASMDNGAEAWDNFEFGLRLGDAPWALMTGTPKRRPWMRELENEAGTVVTRGSTYDNIDNLAPVFIRRVLGKYEGSRLGLQELHGEHLDDVEGALWRQSMIDATRIDAFDRDAPGPSLAAWIASLPTTVDDPLAPDGEPVVSHFARRVLYDTARPWVRVVAVDPPGETAECGIVAGTAPRRAVAGTDHAVVTADYSTTGPPEKWGRRVVKAYIETHADYVVVEANQGGDMTRATIHAVDSTVPVRKVQAQESKKARAEPIAALYEVGWVHHADVFAQLEDQQTTWVPDDSKSPDRLDALVHLIRELLPDKQTKKAKTARTDAYRRSKSR